MTDLQPGDLEIADRLSREIDSMIGVRGAEKLAEAVFDAIERLRARHVTVEGGE